MKMAFTLSILLFCATLVKAEPGQVEFPADYRTFAQYLSLDRTLNHDQIIRLFADEKALSGTDEKGQLKYGSTLVAEVYKALKDENGEVITSSLGKRIRGSLALIAVMQRREVADSDYAEGLRNDDWDFAAFKPDGSVAGKDLNSCAGCHAPLVEQRHLFSYQHLLESIK